MKVTSFSDERDQFAWLQYQRKAALVQVRFLPVREYEEIGNLKPQAMHWFSDFLHRVPVYPPQFRDDCGRKAMADMRFASQQGPKNTVPAGGAEPTGESGQKSLTVLTTFHLLGQHPGCHRSRDRAWGT